MTDHLLSPTRFLTRWQNHRAQGDGELRESGVTPPGFFARL
ncbi:hypothetical protein [Deinococcus cavernae]|nr:hypothetical protein [Deinococcus cavernae]